MKTKTMFSAFLLIALFFMAASPIYAGDGKLHVVEYTITTQNFGSVADNKPCETLRVREKSSSKTIFAQSNYEAEIIAKTEEGFSSGYNYYYVKGTDKDGGDISCYVSFLVQSVKEVK